MRDLQEHITNTQNNISLPPHQAIAKTLPVSLKMIRHISVTFAPFILPYFCGHITGLFEACDIIYKMDEYAILLTIHYVCNLMIQPPNEAAVQESNLHKIYLDTVSKPEL